MPPSSQAGIQTPGQNTLQNQNVEVPAPVSAVMAGPSDWEHFTPTDHAPVTPIQELYTTPTEPPRRQSAMPQEVSAVASPSSHMGEDRRVELSQATLTPLPASKPETSSRNGSVSTIGSIKKIKRQGTIDSVILAWNKPVSTQESEDIRHPTRPESPESRPISPPSAMQSPSAKHGVIAPRPLQHQFSQRAINVPAADLYADIDPEHHSSLARYVNMLRKESAAPSDEEKYKIFQAFIQKESRVRQVLYGIEADTLPSKPQPSAARKPSQNSVQLGNDVPSRALPVELTRSRSSEIKRKPIGSPVGDGPDKTASLATLSNEVADLSTSTNVATDSSPVLPGRIEQTATSHTEHPPGPSLSTQDSTHPTITKRDPMLEQPIQIAASESKNNDRTDMVANTSWPVANDHKAGVSIPAQTTQPQDTVHQSQNDDDDAEYSPGGRPRLGKWKPPQAQPLMTANLGNEERKDVAYPQATMSPSENAPMVIADYEMPNSPGINAPILVESEAASTSLNRRSAPDPVLFHPPRPAYTPFRYNDHSQRSTPPSSLPLDKPADEAYTSLRIQASDGRLLGPEAVPSRPATAPLNSPTASRREQAENFLGLIRSHSKAHHGTRPMTSMALSRPNNLGSVDELTSALTSLRTSLPEKLPDSSLVDPTLASIQTEADTMIDDFSFIRETVIVWDKQNRETRNRQDRERDKRQELAERHLDELFNANEISYADLNTAESDSRVAEATRKYDEDQSELQSFIDTVFTTVAERLQQEISRLTSLYDRVIEILETKSDSVSRQLNRTPDRVQMLAAMGLVLHMFGKLEIRYQKMAEARFERERRRKKLELTVLYTNGNTAGVKRLEQDFNAAEKLQVLQESQNRDSRANKMMDIFDPVAVRGLGDNQTYIDDMVSKIRKVKNALPTNASDVAPRLSSTGDLSTMLHSVQETVDTVLSDSRDILTSSNAADRILNEADYTLSVANAKAANKPDTKAILTKLEADKVGEERKLAEEMAVRLDGMAKAPAEAVGLIREVLEVLEGLGLRTTGMGAEGKEGEGEDVQKKERLRRALEEAKRRNAAKEGQVLP